MQKRLIAGLLVVLLACPCAALAESFVLSGYDDASIGRNWAENAFFTYMEERTGLSLAFEQYGDEAAWTAAKAAMQPGEALPDALFKAELTQAETLALYERGVLIDLAPLLAENCPNLTALLDANPAWREAVTLPGGAIAALPALTEIPVSNYLWINTAWLDALGMDMPDTAQEFTDVLRAFVARDLNRNGRQDEMGLTFLGVFDLKFLSHAFGVIANDYNLFVWDGKAVFAPLTAQYRAFVEWLCALQAEGLLDKNGFFTADVLRRVTDENATNVYGAVIAPMISNILPDAWIESYAVVPALAYDGERVYRSLTGGVTPGAFAITSACEDPAALLRWIDALYDEEAAVHAYMGQEGVDYLVDGDGSWRLSDAVSQGGSAFYAQRVIGTGGRVPGIEPVAFQRRHSEERTDYLFTQFEAANAAAALPFPVCYLTQEEREAIAPLQSALGRCVDEHIARFVLGEVELSDASWQAFEQTLLDNGLQAFLALWQGVLDKR